MTLFYLALAWLLGIYAGDQLAAPWWLWLAAAALPLLGIVVFRQHPMHRVLAGCLLLALLGATRSAAAIHQPGERDLAAYNDQGQLSLSGVIISAPEVRDVNISFQVRVDSLSRAEGETQDVQGVALVRTSAAHSFRYGDRVNVTGKLETPPGSDEGFSYRDYLARRGIYSLIDFAQVRAIGQREGNPVEIALADFRTDAYQKIDRLLPEPESSLLQGILLGLDQGISPDVRDDFNAVSASHIIAISGMNVAIVAGLMMTLLRRFANETVAVVITITGLALYTLFVGADPSVVRAAIMSSLALVALRLNRMTYGPASLGFSALVMTAIQPDALWDVGFQLSFLATFGLIFYVEPLQGLFSRWLLGIVSEGVAEQILSLVSDSLIVTIAAQITTTPLIILVFKRFSLVSLPANFLIIPVQSQIMIWGILGLAAAYVLWPLAQTLIWVAWLFLAWTIWVVHGFAALPFASVALEDVSPVLIGGIYTLMFGVTMVAAQPPEQRTHWWEALKQSIGLKTAVGAGIVLAALLTLAGISLPDGQLHLRFINAGQGSSVLLSTPSGRHILIDAGGSGRTLSAALGAALPFWERSLDVVILTQASEASIGGLPDVLNRYQVQALMLGGGRGGQIYSSVQDTVRTQGGRVQTLGPGATISVGDGVSLTAIPNGEGLSLVLAYGQMKVLILGSWPADGSLATAAPTASVIYIADPTGLEAEALLAGKPQIVILGNGKSLLPEAAAQIDASGASVYRLDQARSIELITLDGQQVRIKTSK